MKSTWFADNKRREFAKCLRDADYGQRPGELFLTFLRMAHAALFQSVAKLTTGSLDEAVEADYMREVGRIKNPKRMAECFDIMVQGLEERAYDFLGTFSGEVGMNDQKYRGQCFTPDELCKLMAQVTIRDAKPEDGKTHWVSEPACGGGAMLIALAGQLQDQGFYPWHWHSLATDVSWRCYAMTYIQTTLLGIPCIVECGNTLTLESSRKDRNLISVLHPWKEPKAISPLDPEPAEVFDMSQMELF